MAAVSILLALLWALLWALAGVAALLLILLLLILFLPFDIDLRLDSDWAAPAWEELMTGAVRWRSRLRWGGFVAYGVWEGEQFTRTRSEVRICAIALRSRPGRQRARARTLPSRAGVKPSSGRGTDAGAKGCAGGGAQGGVAGYSKTALPDAGDLNLPCQGR